MKLSELYAVANELAPKSLSDEMCQNYGCYDNSGILVDVGEEVDSVLFSLDLTSAAVDEAIERGVKAIVTHHPVIYGKISSIDYHDETMLGNKLVRCIKQGISVVSMHLNLDAASGGIDESLMEGILLSAGEREGAGTRLLATQMPLSDGGYGKVYPLPNVTLGEVADGMKKIFRTERIEVYGDTNRKVTRAASFCGAGADEKAISFALREGADVMISSDFKHHLLCLAAERGLSVITLTHYASEAYGFKKYYEKISQRVEIPCYYHEDKNLL